MSGGPVHELGLAELLAAPPERRLQLIRLPRCQVSLGLGEDLALESGRHFGTNDGLAFEFANLSVRVGWRLAGVRHKLPTPLRLLLLHAWLRYGEAVRRLGDGEASHESREQAMRFLRSTPADRRLQGLLNLAEAVDLWSLAEFETADDELEEAIELFNGCGWASMAVYTRLMRVVFYATSLPKKLQEDLGARRFRAAVHLGADRIAPGLVAELEAKLEAGDDWRGVLDVLEANRNRFEWAAEA